MRRPGTRSVADVGTEIHPLMKNANYKKGLQLDAVENEMRVHMQFSIPCAYIIGRTADLPPVEE